MASTWRVVSPEIPGHRAETNGSFARLLLPEGVPSATYDGANRQRAFGDLQMTYDANGNLMSLTGPAGSTTLVWDARNRLAGVDTAGLTASFTYDPVGRRSTKTINGPVTQYLHDVDDLVQKARAGEVVSYLMGLSVDVQQL